MGVGEWFRLAPLEDFAKALLVQPYDGCTVEQKARLTSLTAWFSVGRLVPSSILLAVLLKRFLDE